MRDGSPTTDAGGRRALSCRAGTLPRGTLAPQRTRGREGARSVHGQGLLLGCEDDIITGTVDRSRHRRSRQPRTVLGAEAARSTPGLLRDRSRTTAAAGRPPRRTGRCPCPDRARSRRRMREERAAADPWETHRHPSVGSCPDRARAAGRVPGRAPTARVPRATCERGHGNRCPLLESPRSGTPPPAIGGSIRRWYRSLAELVEVACTSGRSEPSTPGCGAAPILVVPGAARSVRADPGEPTGILLRSHPTGVRLPPRGRAPVV